MGAAMAKDLGHIDCHNPEKPLTKREYNGPGLVSPSTISKRFSSEERPRDGWYQLKRELQLGTQKHDTEDLRRDVLGAAISKRLGYNTQRWKDPEKPLSQREYDDDLGIASSDLIRQRFSSEEQPQDGWDRLKQELQRAAPWGDIPRQNAYDLDEIKPALDEAARQKVEYEVDGEQKVSLRGVAPPGRDLPYIDIEGLPNHHSTLNFHLPKPYAQYVKQETDWEPPSMPEYENDEFFPVLKEVIQTQNHWSARDRYIPAGETPPAEYIDKHEDLPSYSTIKRRLGSKEDWLSEMRDRNATDVNVDPTDFGL
jgi:hypothetical protein